jgi:solute:Na+ symporter, SSS family
MMLSSIDLIISIVYILGIVGLGLWVSVKSKGQTAKNYFLADKNLSWPMIGLALFATNISCVHLVSLAQSGFDSGLLNGNFEWMASFVLILFALIFAPFYISTGIATLPDFLERRYNKACRDWLAVVSVVSAIVIHIAFSLLSGGIVLKTLFGIDMYVSVVVISLLTTLYTVTGGLKAVVITESVQTIVLILGALLITYFTWSRLGGWHELTEVLRAHQETNKLSMLRGRGESGELPWYAVLLGYPIIGIWYWCADQTIVQRILGARDENHARVGILFCGFIKILPVFIFILPGLMAYALYLKGDFDLTMIKEVGPHGEVIVNSKGIYTLMITQLVPVGFVGILIAALLSGLMSQISGALNAISTIASYDLYQRKVPAATDRQMVRFGRIIAVLAMLLSICLLPLLNMYESIFNGLNDIIAHIAPPITCVFLLGLFWSKASPKSAQYTLWLGSLAGVLVFAFNKLFPNQSLASIPFMLIAFYLFCLCVLLQVCLSFVFPASSVKSGEQLYWNSIWEPLQSKGWSGLGNYKVLSLLLFITMCVLYYQFA